MNRTIEAILLWGIFFMLIIQEPPHYFSDLGMLLIGFGVGSVITWVVFEHMRGVANERRHTIEPRRLWCSLGERSADPSLFGYNRSDRGI